MTKPISLEFFAAAISLVTIGFIITITLEHRIGRKATKFVSAVLFMIAAFAAASYFHPHE